MYPHLLSFKYPNKLNQESPQTKEMEFSGSETESPVSAETKDNKSPKSHESSKKWPRKNKVTLEGYIESDDVSESGSSNGVGRTKSLTDEDLEELKGCLDLGFGFSYDEIPELCSTLPALELCYSMSQRFLDDQRVNESSSCDQDSVTSTSSGSSSSSSPPLVANWKISSPGDDPDEVKARLKYWAQAVACTVRLCS